jgi:hypothetical protein
VARSRYAWAGLAVSFVLLLLYTTIQSTPTPLGQAPEDRLAAASACRRAVGEGVPDARFPLSASVASLGDGRLHLSGSVDSGSGVQAVRRNYECFLRRDPVAGDYVADSIAVWQSH